MVERRRSSRMLSGETEVSYLATDPPWILRMCCFRWSGRQKYFPQRVHVKVYLEPRPPHSYLECRVREDRDLYPRPHMTHRNLSSLAETPSIMGLAVSIHGGVFTTTGLSLVSPISLGRSNNPSSRARAPLLANSFYLLCIPIPPPRDPFTLFFPSLALSLPLSM